MGADLEAVYREIKDSRKELSGKIDCLDRKVADVRVAQARAAQRIEDHEKVDHDRPCGELRTLSNRTWGLLAGLLLVGIAAVLGLIFALAGGG